MLLWVLAKRRYGETYAQAVEATGVIPSDKAAASAQTQEHRAFGDGGRVHAKIGRVPVESTRALSRIYLDVLRRFFAG